MPQQLINLGTAANDRTGTPWRAGGDFINDNFTELYAAVPLNLRSITAESDFATQDASTITLDAGAVYILSSAISTAKTIIFGAGSVYTALNQKGPTHTYVGSGNVFSVVDNDFELRDITVSTASGTYFDVTGSAAGTLSCVIRFVRLLGGAKFGTFTDYDAVDIASTQAIGINDGITIAGTVVLTSFARMFMTTTSATFKGLDFSSAVVTTPEIRDFSGIGPAGAIGITGLVDSGNVPVGSLGMITGTSFTGGMTANTNILHSDIRWQTRDNANIPESQNAADAYLVKGSAVETITITTSTVFEEIGVPTATGVSWASDVAERFTVSTSGVITYVGERTIDAQIVARATVEKVGGGADQLEVRLAKNWVHDPDAAKDGLEKSRAITQNATPTTVPVSALVTLVTNDNIRLIFTNNTSTADILAEVSSMEINA